MKKLIIATAQWCNPCQSYKQVLNELDSSVYDITYLDVDKTDRMELSKASIRGVPTTILQSEDGTEIKRCTGSMTTAQLNKWLGDF